MGRWWRIFAGATFCVACGGKSSEGAPGLAQGGSSGGNVTLESGGTAGGASANGGQSQAAAGGSGPSACLFSTFPEPNSAGGSDAAATLCPDATLYCEFQDSICGRGAFPGGVCASRANCEDDDGPVCGCDHLVYPSTCAAYAAGVDIDANGECQLEGSFFCRGRACKLDTEACLANLNHIDGSISPSCTPLTAECLSALISGEDQFCECVRPGRCTCQVRALEGGTGIVKLCGDR